MIAYVNGEYLPHSDAKISIDDRGLILGDSVFDVARTFGGVPFRMEDHLDRLRRSMRYVELDGDTIIQEVREATDGVLSRNQDVIKAAGDVWIDQVVTRGCPPVDELEGTAMLGADAMRPTVIVKLRQLKFQVFGELYDRGVDLNVSLLGQHFAGAVDPRVKAANRLASTRAELKGLRAQQAGGNHWTVIFGADGSIAETGEANMLIVSEGRLVRPPRYDVLEGISLMTVCELARGAGLEVEERPLKLYDLLNADETMICATSFSLLPVNSIDGIALRTGRTEYRRLLEAWFELVGCDFADQARTKGEALIMAEQPGPGPGRE